MLFVQTGLQKDGHQAEKLKSELWKEDDNVSGVIGSAEHLRLTCIKDAVVECDISLVSSTSITAPETGNLINHSTDTESNDLLSGDDAISTTEVEADTREPDKCHSGFTPDSSGLDVVESNQDGERFTADGMPRSEEFDKVFITNNDTLGTVECGDDAYTDGSAGMAAVQSDSCSEAYSADSAGLRNVDSGDASNRQRISGIMHATGRTANNTRPSSAVGDSPVSSTIEYIDSLHSLVSQLKSAINSAQSGITALCQVIVGSLWLYLFLCNS